MAKITPAQTDWIRRMESALEHLHNQWIGYEFAASGRMHKIHGGIDKALFKEIDRKVRWASEKLNIIVQDTREAAEQNDFWDGEMYGPIVVLRNALREIKQHFTEKAA